MKKVFHGWWMVGAGSLMQFVQGTLLLQSFGAYFAVQRDDRGWSKTELSGAAAMHQLEAAVLGPVLGWFLDRFGAQMRIANSVQADTCVILGEEEVKAGTVTVRNLKDSTQQTVQIEEFLKLAPPPSVGED